MTNIMYYYAKRTVWENYGKFGNAASCERIFVGPRNGAFFRVFCCTVSTLSVRVCTI